MFLLQIQPLYMPHPNAHRLKALLPGPRPNLPAELTLFNVRLIAFGGL